MFLYPFDAAEKCDAVLLVMGGNEFTSREGWAEDHTGDRVDLNLLGRQDELAEAIFSLGKKTAVVLINGRPLAITYLAENAPAIIEGFYLGQEQGTAVANVLFGEVNSGDRAGDEIVQLYIRDKVSSVTRPVKELKDFKRISLGKGEMKTVEFTITSEKLQFYDIDMNRLVEPGEFEVMLGKNSIDYLSEIFEVISN
ncbi:MAG: glycoside hydrolase family 3 C-terminal domain-containing protein [Spirochaetales bacterium]|jgi:hypothetical protein|nr:glycoside hydrolase family 3 C-terminal domain-containing protein [Spirochaetales bacterium]